MCLVRLLYLSVLDVFYAPWKYFSNETRGKLSRFSVFTRYFVSTFSVPGDPDVSVDSDRITEILRRQTLSIPFTFRKKKCFSLQIQKRWKSIKKKITIFTFLFGNIVISAEVNRPGQITCFTVMADKNQPEIVAITRFSWWLKNKMLFMTCVLVF